MNIEIIITSIIAFLIGGIIVYLVLKSSQVKRSLYDQLKEQFSSTKNLLDTKIALEKDLKFNFDSIKNHLNIEKETNKKQETELAKINANISSLQERFTEEKEINTAQQNDIKQNNNYILTLKTELVKFETLNNSLVEKLHKQKEEFEESRKKSLLEFENVANKIFEEKSNKFSQQSEKSIERLLNPLKENLKEFKQQVTDTYDKEAKERFSLEAKIKELVTLNQQISNDATNLTNALKGQSKTQGDWGEMILESILEYSGLVKNREYFIQESFRDEKGKLKQPDVVIKYPDDRYIVIDSKVSLTAYEKYVNGTNPEEQEIHLNSHIKSLKNHIDNLSSKEYENFNNALDFVFLFVPIEPAFLSALQHDNTLWNYAYNKRIVLISPTNLIATLRVIVDVWKKEKQNNNAREIAKRGEMLYNKFVGFVTDMKEIDKHIQKAGSKYNDAFSKLSSGKGNLISQAESLKKLGVNSKKELPSKFL